MTGSPFHSVTLSGNPTRPPILTSYAHSLTHSPIYSRAHAHAHRGECLTENGLLTASPGLLKRGK